MRYPAGRHARAPGARRSARCSGRLTNHRRSCSAADPLTRHLDSGDSTPTHPDARSRNPRRGDPYLPSCDASSRTDFPRRTLAPIHRRSADRWRRVDAMPLAACSPALRAMCEVRAADRRAFPTRLRSRRCCCCRCSAFPRSGRTNSPPYSRYSGSSSCSDWPLHSHQWIRSPRAFRQRRQCSRSAMR